MDNRFGLPANTILDSSYRIERVIGSGGFGITYEAEDVNLGTEVAIKEYYPFDFGDRDASMSVRPKSDRHKQTFEWGRSSFLQEARMLARFRHPNVVRVSRVFEANSTAYMVMDFERGKNFETWLRDLGRQPSQQELDRIAGALLDALEIMHAEGFLHRDIAPDNIVVREDGSPVLLDFGAARRAIAEMSRSLTGIIKAGYSPQEQYASDSRLQGPWSDLYALGATLYHAVSGMRPEEATLRVTDDRMRPAAEVAGAGAYRQDFLAAIDACLKVRPADRPQSVAQLRPMLLSRGPPAVAEPASNSMPTTETRALPAKPPPIPAPVVPASRESGLRWPMVLVPLVLLGAILGVNEYTRWREDERRRLEYARTAKAEQDRKVAEAERMRKEAERHEQEAKEAARRKVEADTSAPVPPKPGASAMVTCGLFPNLPKDHPFNEIFKNVAGKCRMDALGMTVASAADASKQGVTISDVDSASDAAKKGLKAGDVILKVGELHVAAPGDLAAGVSEAVKLGRKAVLLLVKTGSEMRFVAVRLAAN